MRKIAAQSKEWIVNSFFDLLSVKPLDSITISEITQNADLDRRTFYRHFKTKDDVIRYYIHKKAEQCAEALRQINETIDIFTIAHIFYTACNGMKHILQILYRQNLMHIFYTEINILIPKYHYESPLHEIPPIKNYDYILAYTIGGLCNMLTKWLVDDCMKTPAQMAEFVMQAYSTEFI